MNDSRRAWLPVAVFLIFALGFVVARVLIPT